MATSRSPVVFIADRGDDRYLTAGNRLIGSGLSLFNNRHLLGPGGMRLSIMFGEESGAGAAVLSGDARGSSLKSGKRQR